MQQLSLYCFIIFYSILLCNEFNYKINMFGINMANCKVVYSDTVLNNQDALKVQYSVKTNQLINRIFKVNNEYTIILNRNAYNQLYYQKNTYQPHIKNTIETEIIGDNIKYKNSNIIINPSDKNIFSILSIIQNNELSKLSEIEVIEREGKYYHFNYNLLTDNKISIEFNELNVMNTGLIEHTDIFLWGLFKDNSQNIIILDQNKNHIEQCIFQHGIIKITATLQK
jgi:hypothetical protein